MAVNPPIDDELASLIKRVAELEKAMKTGLQKEAALARRIATLENTVKVFYTEHLRLQARVGQLK